MYIVYIYIIILYYIILYYTILYYIILCYIILYYTLLYYIILYYIMLYMYIYTILLQGLSCFPSLQAGFPTCDSIWCQRFTAHSHCMAFANLMWNEHATRTMNAMHVSLEGAYLQGTFKSFTSWPNDFGEKVSCGFYSSHFMGCISPIPKLGKSNQEVKLHAGRGLRAPPCCKKGSLRHSCKSWEEPGIKQKNNNDKEK